MIFHGHLAAQFGRWGGKNHPEGVVDEESSARRFPLSRSDTKEHSNPIQG
jgi:hypothetical protein|tara:strand:- start:542 stop:691 length:150 start_codon:yes stop_codon:yes gene_type:complete